MKRIQLLLLIGFALLFTTVKAQQQTKVQQQVSLQEVKIAAVSALESWTGSKKIEGQKIDTVFMMKNNNEWENCRKKDYCTINFE